MLRFGSSLPEVTTRSRSSSSTSEYGRFSPQYSNFEPSMSDEEDDYEEDQLNDLFNNFRRLGNMSFGLPDLRHTVLSPRSFLQTLEEEDEDDIGRGSLVTYLTTKTYATGLGADGRPTVVEKTKTTRKSHGISEVQKSLRDSRTGVERLEIKRTLGSKGRTLIRERTPNGTERSHEDLHNLAALEADQFDEEWCRKAERTLIDTSTFLGNDSYEEEEEFELDLPSAPNLLPTDIPFSIPPVLRDRYAFPRSSMDSSRSSTSSRPSVRQSSRSRPSSASSRRLR